MTLGEKIRQTIRAKGFQTLKEFHASLVDLYEEHAITQRTLIRVLKGHVMARGQTLSQIAVTLGVQRTFLREGTNAQIPDIKEKTDVFPYNDRATLHSFRNDLPFIPEKLVLRAGGRTSTEQDRSDAKESLKWFFVWVGRVKLVTKGPLGEEKRTFRKGEHFTFDARQLHYFENDSKSPSVVHIIHYPAKNSDFSTEHQT